VSTYDFYRALLEQWDDVLSRLPAEHAGRVQALVADVVAGRLDPDDVIVDLAGLLAPVLHEGDAVLEALTGDRRAVLEADSDLDVEAEFHRIVAGLGDLVLRTRPERRTEPPNSPAAVWRRARRRLLRVPHLVEPPAVGAQGAAADDGLIRLPRRDGGHQLPRFQFDDDLRPHDLVMRVNRLLDADDDPWGVADWWVSPHAVLDDPPATLLGTTREHELWAAASALVSRGA
jgi:hypothetical protein